MVAAYSSTFLSRYPAPSLHYEDRCTLPNIGIRRNSHADDTNAIMTTTKSENRALREMKLIESVVTFMASYSDSNMGGQRY